MVNHNFTYRTFRGSSVSHQATLQLPPDVAGVTLLALGNGAPDVFTAIAAAQALNFPLLLADLLGGSVFIATVVVGCVILVARTRAGGRVQLVDVAGEVTCMLVEVAPHFDTAL